MNRNTDHDLSEIMKEIEALENDFRQEEKEFAKSPIIEELAQLNEELSAPVGITATEDQTFDWFQGDKEEPVPAGEAEVFTMKGSAAVSHIGQVKEEVASKAAKPSQISFNFPPAMPVSMEFHRGKELVHFTWTDEGFQVEVEGGMSFSIPTQQSYKKAS